MSSRPEFMKMKTYFAIKSTMKHWNEDGEREWSCNWIIPEECCFIYARSCFLVVSYSVNMKQTNRSATRCSLNDIFPWGRTITEYSTENSPKQRSPLAHKKNIVNVNPILGILAHFSVRYPLSVHSQYLPFKNNEDHESTERSVRDWKSLKRTEKRFSVVIFLLDGSI